MATDLGIITAERMVSDKLFQTATALSVMEKGFEGSRLYRPEIVTDVDMKGDLELILPGINSVAVQEDVAEGQDIGVTNASFMGATLKLKKTSGIISITDEAIIRSNARGLDAFGLQQKQLQDALARRIDYQIVEALNTTPQTGTAFVFSSGNLYNAYAEAQGKLERDISAVVCSPECKVRIFGNINASSFTGSNPAAPYDMARLPGTDVPVIASRAVTTDDMYFVSVALDPVLYGKHEPQTDSWRGHTAGTVNMRIDNFTGALSNYFQTDDNKAAGVVKTAWS